MLVPRKTQNARRLRNESTEAEKKLWFYLKSDQLGCRFRRQLSIGPYIADFACPEKKLVIELDGGQHAEQQGYDDARTKYIESKGYKVLRFWNNDILGNIEGILETIMNSFNHPLPDAARLSLSLQGEGLRERAIEKTSALDKIRITGGQALNGTIPISGAKNAALKLMCASLLSDQPVYFENSPNGLRDINSQTELLEHLGCVIKRESNVMAINAARVENFTAPYDIVRKMRGSILVLGPLLARFGQAKVSLPGGCAIGTRPVDLHIKGLEEMGAKITLDGGYINASTPAGGLQGAKIIFPKVSVGATENLLMAATLANGTTTLINAAREPEIVDLGECLIKMGAKIEGINSPTLTITGVDALGGAEHSIIPDRIETGTFIVAAAITGGELEITNCDPTHLMAVLDKLRSVGVQIEQANDTTLRVSPGGKLIAKDVTTAVHPGFPTDMQAQYMALMTQAEGDAVVTEMIFENRFMHASELQRLGARIRVHGHSAYVHGPTPLNGAQLIASDLRASASLVLAGLAAEGETWIDRVYHIDRGYEKIEEKLRAVGANIERVKS